MGVVKIMSVGKSGVGKSTIGNCLISGVPTADTFKTSSSADSCTQDYKWVESKDVHYCDVPGIPDTNAENTKAFYDILIKEARKELNAIFFVFKFERIDNAAYSKAKMLFREVRKSQAIKILVINDMNNYAFGNQATPKDYEVMADSIKECTGLSFTYVINMTAATMVTSMTNVKQLLSKTKAYPSHTLKTYVQLKAYVDELTSKQSYEKEVYDEGMAQIAKKENELNTMEATAASLAAAASAASAASFFTFGATLGIATPTAIAAASTIAAIEMKKQDLQEARNNMSKDKLKEATELLKEACKSFQELDDALMK